MTLLPTARWIKEHQANDIDVWREHVRLQHPGLTHGPGWDVVHRHHADHYDGEADHEHKSRR